jgi:disulfide bond formation protein DsbB
MKTSKWIYVLVIAFLALALAACGGSDENEPTGNGAATNGDGGGEVAAGDPVRGQEQFDMVCIACHGPGGVGVEGLGKPFTTSEFVRSQTDAELLAFVKVGRPIGHPDNTTGVDMPPKGGNPALTDEDLLDIIAYIRTLQE